MGRPRPVPPCDRRLVKKGSNRRSRSAGGTPGPSSTTDSTTCSPTPSALIRARLAPAWRLFSSRVVSTVSTVAAGAATLGRSLGSLRSTAKSPLR